MSEKFENNIVALSGIATELAIIKRLVDNKIYSIADLQFYCKNIFLSAIV